MASCSSRFSRTDMSTPTGSSRTSSSRSRRKQEGLVLQPIEGFPDDVIAVRAVGQMTADDAQSVLVPAISRITASGRKVRLVLEIGDDFDPYGLGGVFTSGSGGMADIGSFEKLAVI